MRKIIIFLIITAFLFSLINISESLAFGGEETKDKFIWVSSTGRSFTEEEINLLAGKYEVVIIANAHWDFTKKNYQTEASRLKAVNSNVKVFPYYNAKYHFLKDKRVDASQGFLDEWYLKDKSGNIIPKKEGTENFYLDLINVDYRRWIVAKISEWLTDGNIDNNQKVDIFDYNILVVNFRKHL